MLISLSWNLLAFNRHCKLLSQGHESLKAFGIASCQNAGISPSNTALITKTLIQCVLPLFSYYILVDSYKLRSLHDMFLFFSPVQILPCEIFLIIIFNVSQKTVLHLNCLFDWLITYFYFIFCGFFPLLCLWGKFLINALWQEVTQFMKSFCLQIREVSWGLIYPKTAAFLQS